MHKKNPVVIASLSMLALAIGAGAGLSAFVFHEDNSIAQNEYIIPNKEGGVLERDHVTYTVGQFQTTNVDGTKVNHACYFVDPVTQLPLTGAANLKRKIPLTDSFIPYGTEAKVGIPVLFKKVNNEWVVDSEYTFVGWSQLKNKVFQMVNNETSVPDLHSFVSDGYSITARLDGDKDSSDPTGLQLYPSFYRSKIRCYADWNYNGMDCQVTLPYMKTQLYYYEDGTKERSQLFYSFRLVNLPDFDKFVLTSSDRKQTSFSKGNLFANAELPYDIFVTIVQNDDPDALTNSDREFKSKIPALDAINYAHYDTCSRISNLDGIFNFDISFYYKKAVTA